MGHPAVPASVEPGEFRGPPGVLSGRELPAVERSVAVPVQGAEQAPGERAAAQEVAKGDIPLAAGIKAVERPLQPLCRRVRVAESGGGGGGDGEQEDNG